MFSSTRSENIFQHECRHKFSNTSTYLPEHILILALEILVTSQLKPLLAILRAADYALASERFWELAITRCVLEAVGKLSTCCSLWNCETVNSLLTWFSVTNLKRSLNNENEQNENAEESTKKPGETKPKEKKSKDHKPETSIEELTRRTDQQECATKKTNRNRTRNHYSIREQQNNNNRIRETALKSKAKLNRRATIIVKTT